MIRSAPGPGPLLLAAVQRMQRVRTRSPARGFATIMAIGLVVSLAALGMMGPRADLGALPLAWVVLVALAWAAVVVLLLGAAVLPARGDVLPDGVRASRLAAGVAGAMILLGLFATVDAPGRTVMPPATLPGFASAWWHCTRAAVVVEGPVMIAAWVALRRLLPMGNLRVAAAVGAAGGALAGLTLHFICPVGGGLHVGLAHGGAVLVGALLAMAGLARALTFPKPGSH